jgi:hypothetical protein
MKNWPHQATAAQEEASNGGAWQNLYVKKVLYYRYLLELSAKKIMTQGSGQHKQPVHWGSLE